MLQHDLVSSARLRHLGTSAQKTRLVVNMIRGKDVGEAVATLRHTKKAVAREIARLLDSAVANAHQKRQDIDVDRLFIQTAFVDGGPSQKRIRPAPMGRAFRILKRTCHVTVGLGQKPEPERPAPKARGDSAGEAEPSAPGTLRKAGPARRKAAARAGARRKSGARGGARKSRTVRTKKRSA